MIQASPLGISWSSLDPRKWSLCDVPGVVNKLPVVRDAVKRFGCHPAGRAAAQTYLVAQFGPAAVGLNVALSCICDKEGAGAAPPTQPEPEQQKPFWTSPAGVGLLATGAFALTMLIRK